MPTAQLFMDRYQLLKEAAFIGDIKSVERGGTLWFKPVNLAAYALKEWAYMPSSARALMTAAGLDADVEKEEAAATAVATESATAAFAPASANTPADGAVEPQEGHSFSGVSEGDKFKACKAWLISEMQKSPTRPPFKTFPELQKHCKSKFGIAKHPFRAAFNAAKKATNAAFNAAQEATRVDWYGPGKPKKSAANSPA